MSADPVFPDSDASPWPSLHADLVDLIGWRVLAVDLLDYVRFRAACAHWRASTVSPLGRGILDPRFRPRHWRIVPPDPDDRHLFFCAKKTKTDPTRRFSNPSTGATTSTRLLAGHGGDGHLVLDSVDGLLLVEQGGPEKPVRLLHPFTGDALDLPPLPPSVRFHAAFTDLHERQLRGNVATALTVSGAAAATVAVAIRGLQRVLFAGTGDRQWSSSAWTLSLSPPPMPVSFRGKLYVLGSEEETPAAAATGSNGARPILELDPLLPAPKLVAMCPVAELRSPVLEVRDSETLVVKGYDSGHTVVYRVDDLVAGKMDPYVRIPPKKILAFLPMCFTAPGNYMFVNIK